MKHKPSIYSVGDFRSELRYDDVTGQFYRVRSGKSAGGRCGAGYILIQFRNRQYLAHRLAWFITYGTWPELIDHINGDKSDNRIVNLRVATKSTNAAASKKTWAQSGCRGVYAQSNTKKWRVRVRTPDGKNLHVGYFDTIEQATAAHKTVMDRIYGAFSPYSENDGGVHAIHG